MKAIVMIFVLLMVVATIGFAQEPELTASFGNWDGGIQGSMLDGMTYMAITEGDDDAFLAMIRQELYDFELGFGVIFPKYIGSQMEKHDKALIYITDQMEEPVTIRNNMFRSSGSAIRISDSDDVVEFLAAILLANELLVRTYDYNGRAVDAIFILIPDDSVAAWTWLTEQVESSDDPTGNVHEEGKR